MNSRNKLGFLEFLHNSFLILIVYRINNKTDVKAPLLRHKLMKNQIQEGLPIQICVQMKSMTASLKYNQGLLQIEIPFRFKGLYQVMQLTLYIDKLPRQVVEKTVLQNFKKNMNLNFKRGNCFFDKRHFKQAILKDKKLQNKVNRQP